MRPDDKHHLGANLLIVMEMGVDVPSKKKNSIAMDFGLVNFKKSAPIPLSRTTDE